MMLKLWLKNKEIVYNQMIIFIGNYNHIGKYYKKDNNNKD